MTQRNSTQSPAERKSATVQQSRSGRSSKGGVAVFATMAVLALVSEGLAQAPSNIPTDVYSPSSALQTPPLRVEVLDGARFRDIETHAVYRLYGVETCAPGQKAELGRQPWPCGSMATAWLVKATLNRWVACNTLRQEKGEQLARCSSADHADIAADMLRDGMAVASPPTDRDPPIKAYVAAEADAHKAYRGLWASSFEMPWEFRARQGVQAKQDTTP